MTTCPPGFPTSQSPATPVTLGRAPSISRSPGARSVPNPDPTAPNKPNFEKPRIDLSTLTIQAYDKTARPAGRKNKPNQSQSPGYGFPRIAMDAARPRRYNGTSIQSGAGGWTNALGACS